MDLRSPTAPKEDKMSPDPYVMTGVYVIGMIQILAIWIISTYGAIDSFSNFGMYNTETICMTILAIIVNWAILSRVFLLLTKR